MTPRAKAEETGSSGGGAEGGSFDERLRRLEQLVRDLEGGDLSLEESLERYTVGVELLKSCRRQLDQFRKKVEELPVPGDEAR